LGVSTRPRRDRTIRDRPLYEQKEPFLVSALTLVVMVVAAYLIAIFAFAFMSKLASLVGGTWFDDAGIRGTIVFLHYLVITIGLTVPLFNRELDPGTRRFMLMLLTFITGYGACKFAGIVDPNIPFNYVYQHVMLPLQHSMGH
jgi:uncharacterized oligopeptide transporter (OPT) family protein